MQHPCCHKIKPINCRRWSNITYVKRLNKKEKAKKKKNMQKVIMLQLSARMLHVRHSPGVFKMDPAEVVIRSLSTRGFADTLPSKQVSIYRNKSQHNRYIKSVKRSINRCFQFQNGLYLYITKEQIITSIISTLSPLCLCVCMTVYTHKCMCVCVCVCACARACVCVQVCRHLCVVSLLTYKNM